MRNLLFKSKNRISNQPSSFWRGGFTLLEAVLYLAIAGIVLYFVSAFGFNAIFGRSKIDSFQDVNSAGRAVLDEISNTIRDGEAINGVYNYEAE